MEYTKLGSTDIKISKICVGCMSFGKAGTMHDWTLDESATEEVVKHALDLGINFFDTANGYSEGTSEEYLGRALKRNVQRDKVIIASKVYFNPGRLSREAINREIDGSLKRLGTDYLDLYMIHRFDYETPIEETMEALNGLVKAGKVRALGASAMYGYQFYNMQLAARDNGWARFEAMENHYNLLYREDERELIPICRQMGVSLMPYSSLAAGHLTRRTWNTDTLRSRTDRAAMGKYDLALLPAALSGGLVAYLFYNWHPAKVFMGDTGSLFLGGVVCAMAFALEMPLILILIGFVYVCEAMSDILQVSYFKATHGKRLFKMAPIHHHFEMCGWKEEKIVLVFAGVTATMCVLAWFGIAGLVG